MPVVTSGGDDLVVSFQIDAGAFRGRLVRLGASFGRIIDGHDYPPPVAAVVGETLTLAAALADMLKFDGLFSLQIQGDGPIRMVVADVTSTGDMRAHATFDRAALDSATRNGGSVPDLFGKGFLAFTVDQGPDSERYQGIVELTGDRLADCAHQYFRQSEQLETSIRLAVRRPEHSGQPWAAAALMLQRMPIGPGAPILTAEQADESWRTALILLDTLTEGELLDPVLTPPQLLYRLFHAAGLQVHPARSLRARCRCSREKVERTLRSFPRAEIEDMRQPDGLVAVTCEFCKARYDFDAAALDSLYLPHRVGEL
ncbi:MAG: Hsp33 family molecular chaperone HslO [Alphaproteobacteria bacterium]